MSNTQYRGEKIHHKIHRHAVHHVHRLRSKSESHRKIVSFSIAFVVTLIVFVLWYFLSLPKMLGDYQVKLSENKRLDKNPLNKISNIFNNDENNIDNIEGNNIEIK
jgi:hypothetical protein